MKKLLSYLTIIIILTSCAPRGEYKTVDSLLAISKERYAKVASVETPAKAELAPLTEKLEGVLKDQQLAAEIAESLRKLTNKAGYPSRPAMSELVLQYENIATSFSEGNSTYAETEAAFKPLVDSYIKSIYEMTGSVVSFEDATTQLSNFILIPSQVTQAIEETAKIQTKTVKI